MRHYSVIIPVFNRPDEVDELLDSLTRQEGGQCEIIVVEDGSTIRCDHIVDKYRERLNAKYYFKPNSGPGLSRNYGAERSRGEWLLFLDSDCTVPADWLKQIEAALDRETVDAFGGPDRAHPSFTATQRAIDYSMTSFLTTGGMRGARRSICRFWPRSFNMGVRRDVFDSVGGFSDMRYGEDLDLSYRLAAEGHTTALFRDAWVYHKRRTCFAQFFRQIFNSGRARIVLSRRHRGTLRPVHVLPSLLTFAGTAALILSIWSPWLLVVLALFPCLILADATMRTKCPVVGGCAVVATFIQLAGYGAGFITRLL